MKLDLRLYALADPAVSGGRSLADLARRIAGSATLVQLRDKHGSTKAMMAEARALIGVAGEIAAARARGPGSFAMEILDALYALDRATLLARAKVS